LFILFILFIFSYLTLDWF